MVAETWGGDNPFFLIIERDGPGGNVGIDLDEHGWAETYKEAIRSEGTWVLVHKASGVPVLAVLIGPGDQGYYTARHVGKAGGGGSNEVIAFGIGKKCADGSMVRLWNINGMTCGGDDVDALGIRLLERLGPR